MSEESKYFKEVKAKLNTKSEKQTIEVLKDLQKTGKPEILPLIIEQAKHTHSGVSTLAIDILGKLKDKECIPHMINGIDGENNDHVFKKQLIMTCWQSGLDYSEYITFFAKEFVQGNFEVAIEAFTVIEEWIHNSSRQEVESCKTLLKNEVSSVQEDKKAFYLELVKLVDGYL